MIRHRLASAIAASCAVLAASAFGPPADAATKAGVTMPDTMQVEGQTLQLNGLGLRSFTILQIRGYVGGLYLKSRTSDAERAMSEAGPKALVIHYIRAATQAQVHQLYMDSSRNYCSHHTCTEADKSSFEILLAAARPVQPGDQSSFLLGQRGIDVLFDGRKVAHLDDASFGRAILESDLGATPPSEDLKRGLLGLDTD